MNKNLINIILETKKENYEELINHYLGDQQIFSWGVDHLGYLLKNLCPEQYIYVWIHIHRFGKTLRNEIPVDRLLGLGQGEKLKTIYPKLNFHYVTRSKNEILEKITQQNIYTFHEIPKVIKDGIVIPQKVSEILGIDESLLRTIYCDKNSGELVKDILNNFGNSVKKITSNRRKDHPDFKINDEYDVQDILYVIIKSVFPNLITEDAIPKVGGASSKIDLILREEDILIETKMIKETDKNENNIIKELKIDFESYHKCKWLKKLFCFVYDPYNKTRDSSNFKDLNGKRTKNGHEYDVEIIVSN